MYENIFFNTCEYGCRPQSVAFVPEMIRAAVPKVKIITARDFAVCRTATRVFALHAGKERDYSKSVMLWLVRWQRRTTIR